MTTGRADLVIVGGGTVGGWASVFAAEAGVGRVVVVERGLVGDGASSRAAGIVRAQGGTSATVAFGRWSIDFYRGQAARYGTDSGFRELGYVILAVTEGDEVAGRERRCNAPLASTSAADAAEAARVAARLPRRPPRRQPRDGRRSRRHGTSGYSLAMAAAGVEPERTAVTASPSATAVVGVDWRERSRRTG
jgi:sarcosine oxidase subunit beta